MARSVTAIRTLPTAVDRTLLLDENFKISVTWQAGEECQNARLIPV